MVKFTSQCDNCVHKSVCHDRVSIINTINEILADNLSSGTCKLTADFKCNNYENNSNKEKEDLLKIIGKIREEINTARYVDKDTKLCKNVNASGLEIAMQIIDEFDLKKNLM